MGFPKLGVPFWGSPTIRIIAFSGTCWVSLFWEITFNVEKAVILHTLGVRAGYRVSGLAESSPAGFQGLGFRVKGGFGPRGCGVYRLNLGLGFRVDALRTSGRDFGQQTLALLLA